MAKSSALWPNGEPQKIRDTYDRQQAARTAEEQEDSDVE